MPLPRQAVIVFASLLTACGGSSSGGGAPEEPVECTGFGDWQQSAYVLPYTVGEAYRVNQANCSGFGHSDFWLYGYDFDMPIGTVVTAARSGVVAHAQDGARDGDRSRTNGVFVTIGQAVAAGDVIGLSGDTGNTGGLPHLHISLHPCGALPGLPGTGSCDSIPVNFRNTTENPSGLRVNRTYEALPFD